MSEKLHTPERESSPEQNSNLERKEAVARDSEPAKAEVLDVGEARAAIREAEPKTRENSNNQAEIDNPDTTSDVRWWSKELGAQTFERTLSSVRRKLSLPDRQLSKFIHKPVVEKVSDIGGKTVARPSGILLGGIFSFVGSLAVYILAKHVGGELRYSIFAATFIIGYLAGLTIELIWRLIARKKA